MRSNTVRAEPLGAAQTVSAEAPPYLPANSFTIGSIASAQIS